MWDIVTDYGHRKPKSEVAGLLVAVDAGRGVVADSTAMRFLGRRYRYLAIRSDVTSGRDIARFSVQDVKGRTLALVASYQVKCAAGNERSAIAALSTNGGSLQESFERFMERWLLDFVEGCEGGRQGFFEAFETKRLELARHLREKARTATGLELSLDLLAEGESELKPVHIKDLEVVARPKDDHENVALRISADLEVAEGGRVRALLTRRTQADLEDCVRSAIRETIRGYDPDDLHFKFEREVLPRLRQALEEALEPNGRRALSVSIRRESRDGEPPPTLDVSCTVNIPLQDISSKVPIIHRLHLKLVSIKQFRRLGIAPKAFEEWIKEKLADISRDVLFRHDFAGLVLEFTADKAAIQSKVEETMKDAGYDIQMYSMLPDLEPVRLQHDGFDFSIEGNFPTRVRWVEAGVEISVKGRIPDLAADPVRRRLKPPGKDNGGSLERDIELAARNAVKWAIGALEPEIFYRHFDFPTETVIENAKLVAGDTVADLLAREIDAVLRKEFAADEIVVLARIDQNDLTRRIVQLCHGQQEATVELQPVANAGDAYGVTFELSYKITGIAEGGWSAFQANAGYARRTDDGGIDIADELKEICALVERTVRQKLELVPAELLQYRDSKTKREIDRVVAEMIRSNVSKVFGLAVEVINLARKLTSEEAYRRRYRDRVIEASEDENKRRLTALQQDQDTDRRILGELADQIRELREKRTDLVASDGFNPEDIELLDEQIAKLEEQRGQRREQSKLPAVRAAGRPAPDFDFDSLLDEPPAGTAAPQQPDTARVIDPPTEEQG